jgi:hypothetical protein
VFALLAQALRHLRGATDAQERDFIAAFEQCIEGLEMREQDRGGFRADAGDARDVVDRVAAQRAAPRIADRYGTSSTRRSTSSSVSKCASSAAAVFAPMPGTPGMLSIASPVSAR